MSRELRNVGASIRARLTNLARTRSEDFQRVLQRYAIERLLARLTRSKHAQEFTLKGAMLYVVWGGVFQRPTRDLDLLGAGDPDPDSVLGVFEEVCSMEIETDGIRFDLATLNTTPIRESAEQPGVRVKVDACLEQARLPIQVDIAFGEAVVPEAGDVEFPTLLELGPMRLRGYPHEVVLAEKLHAAVSLADLNSRLKDFYDLCVIPQLFVLEDVVFGRSLHATFGRRLTALPRSIETALPSAFFRDPDRAQRWRALIDRDDLTLVPRDFEQVGERIRSELNGGLVEAHRLASIADAGRSGP